MSWKGLLGGALNSEWQNRRAPIALFLFLGTAVLFLISNVFHIPLVENPLLLAGFAFLLGLVFAIAVLLCSIASCISEEIMYLAAETRREAGAADGNVAEAVQVFTGLFDFWEKTLQRRPNNSIVVTLFGANRAMKRARRKISQPGEGASLAVINSAGEELARYCTFLHGERFGYLYSHAKRFISPNREAADSASKAIQVFRESARVFLKKPQFSSAHAACMESRRAGFFLHCAWPEYSLAYGKESEELSSFAQDLQQTILAMEALASDVSPSERQLLEKYGKSVRRRLDALHALTQGNRPLVWRILETA